MSKPRRNDLSYTTHFIIKSVFLNSFLIENKCLINLGHTDLGTEEMSSREWWPKWHRTAHAACAPSQRLREHSVQRSVNSGACKKTPLTAELFLSQIISLPTIVTIQSAIVCSCTFYSCISLGTFLLLPLLFKQKSIVAAASPSMSTYHLLDKGEFALSMMQVN